MMFGSGTRPVMSASMAIARSIAERVAIRLSGTSRAVAMYGAGPFCLSSACFPVRTGHRFLSLHAGGAVPTETGRKTW